MSVISGEAYWAHIITPNTKFNPDGEWSIEVCNLNAKNKKIIAPTPFFREVPDELTADLMPSDWTRLQSEFA